VVDGLFFEFDHVFDFLPFFEHRPADNPGVFSEEGVEAVERLWGRVEMHEPVAVRNRVWSAISDALCGFGAGVFVVRRREGTYSP